MGIFFVSKQECPARQTGQALKYLSQSKIQTRPHRSQGEGKTNTESRKQASKGILFCGVPDAQTGHSPHRHRLQRL